MQWINKGILFFILLFAFEPILSSSNILVSFGSISKYSLFNFHWLYVRYIHKKDTNKE